MAKTVPSSKFQEWAGLDRINFVAHSMHCIFREISKDDFGVDGEIEVVEPKPDGNGFQTTGGIIKVQAKSGSSYVKQDSASHFSTPVSEADLKLWNNSTFPVIFIVYHPNDDALYWKEIKTYVRSTPDVWKPPLQVQFDKTRDLFSEASYEGVRSIAIKDQSRIAADRKERLYSNILPINSLPRILTGAPTDFADIREVHMATTGMTPPACILDGILYTLTDLRDPHSPLRSVCDTSKVVDIQATEWLNNETTRRHYVSLLNQLLGANLRRIGLHYSGPHFKRNYFPREDDSSLEFHRTWFNVRTNRHNKRPRIVAKFYTYGSDQFWRHAAANLSFMQFGSAWYLEIVPRYFFTTDGVFPYDNDKVGSYTTRVRSMEHNYQVLNHVLFWSDVLANERPMIELSFNGRIMARISREPETSVIEAAIIQDPARFEEPAEDAEQASLLGVDPFGRSPFEDDDDF